MASTTTTTTTTMTATNLRPKLISSSFSPQKPTTTRFPFQIIPATNNFPDHKKWISNTNKTKTRRYYCYYCFDYHNVSTYPRLPLLSSYSSSSLHYFLSLCSPSLLSYPSLCFLFQSRSPSFRSPFSSMTMTTSVQSSPTPDLPPQSHSPKTVRVVVKGRVQGVFYRNWTLENATQLGLKGWVRNRRDGSVEALFSGDSRKVQEMEQRCRRGPPDAMVTDLQVFPSTDDPGTGFYRKATV